MVHECSLVLDLLPKQRWGWHWWHSGGTPRSCAGTQLLYSYNLSVLPCQAQHSGHVQATPYLSPRFPALPTNVLIKPDPCRRRHSIQVLAHTHLNSLRQIPFTLLQAPGVCWLAWAQPSRCS